MNSSKYTHEELFVVILSIIIAVCVGIPVYMMNGVAYGVITGFVSGCVFYVAWSLIKGDGFDVDDD